MPYAIVTLFGFLSGILLTIWFLNWSFHKSSLTRAPLVKEIHDKYADEFYAYCDLVCGKPPIMSLVTPQELGALIRSREQKDNTNARSEEDSKQGQVSSEETPSTREQS